jgi:hypothetical protein
MNATASAPAKIASKLSIKAMGCQPARGDVKTGDAPRDIAHIYGTVRKYETVTTNYGDSLKFTGEFEGVNLKTGEVTKSFKCFVPTVLEDLLAAALDAKQDGDADLQFGVCIGVEVNDKPGGTGYIFTVRPLVQTVARDALADLRDKMRAAAVPQIAAPVKTAEPAKPEAPAKDGKKGK